MAPMKENPETFKFSMVMTGRSPNKDVAYEG